MHVDASGLTVMDLAANHGRIGVRLHLKAGYAVPVDVAALEIALGGGQEDKSTLAVSIDRYSGASSASEVEFGAHHAVVKREHAHVSAVMDVVPPDNWVAMVFHPDAGQGIV